MPLSGTITNPCVLDGCGEVDEQKERGCECSFSGHSDSYLQAPRARVMANTSAQ